MKRLVLLGLLSDREKILNAIVKSKSIELKSDTVIENTRFESTSEQREILSEQLSRVENCIAEINSQIDSFNNSVSKKDKLETEKSSFLAPLLEADFDDIFNASDKNSELFAKIDEIENLSNEIATKQKKVATANLEIKKLSLFTTLKQPATFYQSTRNTFIALGTIPSDRIQNLELLVSEHEDASFELIASDVDNNLIAVVSLLQNEEFITKLSTLGFVQAQLDFDCLPCERIAQLETLVKTESENIINIQKRIAEHVSILKTLKLVADCYLLQNKLLTAHDTMPQTDLAFVLEGWCPAEKEDEIKSSISQATDSYVVEFHDIKDDEFAPTLNKNNKFVSAFELVTNSYTPQNYHEPDPNPLMSIFYFLIFGLMSADVGYGLVLALAGLFATKCIKQNTGLKALLHMFGMGGFSAMIFGVLFNSYFCYSLPFYQAVIPNPSDFPMITIALSLAIGVLHIATGFISNAIKALSRKDVLGAIFDGLLWAIFIVGLGLGISNMIFEMMSSNMPESWQGIVFPDLAPVGLTIMAVCLVIVLFTGGRNEKGIVKKVVGGLGGIYGVINYFSDLISYVRIFGILLSGVVFGSIINDLASTLGVIAPFLLIFAHAFNLILSCLSIYVHNARLQYVEYFGKFFEGEGRLFKPLGSDLNYTIGR